jgi:O-antigen/teichoic acid export membrane protein
MHDIRHPTVFRIVILIMGGKFALSLPFYTQFGIFAANLRLDYASYVQIGKILLRTGLFFLVLSLGYGIIVLALMSVGTDLVGYVAMLWLARRLSPWMKLRRRHFAFSKMRELVGFGAYVFLGEIAGTVKFRLDNIIIAGYLGVASVTHFNVATKLNGYFFSALNSIVPAPTSLYARYHGKGEMQQIRDKFLILSRIKTTLGILGIGAVLIFARPFITLWVGKAYLDAVAPLIIIMVGRVANVTLSPSVGVVQALYKQKFTAYLDLGEALVNLALSLLLVRWYGLVGVALGTAIPMLATRMTIKPVYICHIMHLPLLRFLRNLLPIILLAAVVQLPLVYAMTQTSIHAYWQIIVWGTGYYAPILVLFYFVILTHEERRLFAQALPFSVKRSKRHNMRRSEGGRS